MIAIIKNSIQEAINRKFILIYFVIVILFLLFTAAILFSMDVKMFFNFDDQQNAGALKDIAKDPMNFIFNRLINMIISPMIGLTLFISFFSVAGFVPGMLEKGTAEIFLSKPISRANLLIGKYLGGLLIGAFQIFFVVVTFWVLVSLKFGIWEFKYLLYIPFYIFIFAIINSLLVFLGVLTQNSVFSLILTYLIYYIISPFFSAKSLLLNNVITSEVGKVIFYTGYFLFPQTSELKDIFHNIIFDLPNESYLPVITGFIWMIVVLFLSILFFRRKDF